MANPTRRDVLKGSLAAAAVLGSAAACGSKPRPVEPEPTPPAPKKKILILGGTGFLGPKTIDAALARGHTVTIFNRGKREKLAPLDEQVHASVEHLYGNRDPDLPADDEKGPDGKVLRPDGSPKGLEQLVGRKWDVVIDNSGFYPRMVTASATLLAPNAAQYIFISSISAYAVNPEAGGDETTELATVADPSVETMGAEFENYGGFKVMCEQAAEAAFPGRATIVRPGFIVGPGDPTDRFTYWPVRIARGGEVAAPGSATDPVQWIDVRDLAEWLITLCEQGTAGTFNALGPNPPGEWGKVLQACIDAAPATAAPKLVWVSTDWLTKNEKTVSGAGEFPIWAPPVDKYAGFHRWSNARATAAGMTLRPIDDTVKALLAWYPTEIERRVRVTAELAEAAKAKGEEPPKGDPSALRAGLKPDQEQGLLAAYKASPA
jgi:2'-hydroxyisoflavone reductase